MRGPAHNTTWASRPCHGFTLVELLVAIAIFVTVMASVALVFNGAVRTSKQGFQNQEAYELARGAMKVIERDLSRAFTNRNHGDVFSFYGTPIGFTYVGLIQADESSAPNMARVTYVVYHDPAFSNLSGAFDQYNLESRDGATVPTYQLLRFVEPGADSLDSFPVPWNQPIDTDNLNSIVLQDVVTDTVNLNAACPPGDAACRQIAEQAAKREIWIRMLAGGDDFVPNAWDDLPYFANRELRPEDYVVAENIRHIAQESFDVLSGQTYCADTLPDLEGLLGSLGFEIDYDDRLYESGTQTCVQRIGSSIVPPVFDNFTQAFVPTADGLRPFFTYWDVGVQENRFDPVTGNTAPNNVITANDKVGPIAFQFWNDWRNLQSDGLDNDGDGVIDVGPDLVFGTADDDFDEIYGENAGSPLDTRLPVAVTVDFTLFFRSPYPGAPDFNERFTQRIDMPTAYRRTFKQRVPDPTP